MYCGNGTHRTLLLRVSVIIPIYDGEQDLPDLLRCLRAQTYPPDQVEYLLIDNRSHDGTADILRQAAQEAASQGTRLFHLTESRIQSSYAARNAGIRASTGDILAFTDVDCRPQPGWLQALVQPFGDPAVGLVAGEIVALPGTTLAERYAERARILSQRHTLAHPYRPYGQTANLAIRREALKQAGLFRPHLTSGGDADLCWRVLHQTSWRLQFAERAVVQHRHRRTFRELRGQFRRHGQGHRYLHELHAISLTREFTWKEALYRLARWLVKEVPTTTLKVMACKATLAEFLRTPIDLLTFQARSSGQRGAELPEAARQIEWL